MLAEESVNEVKEELEELFSGYYEHAGGFEYRYHHLLRVHRYVEALLEMPEIADKDIDEEVVELAALLHDIGRADHIEDSYMNPFNSHEGHAEKSADMLPQFVSLGEERLNLLQQVVANHHSDAETPEGKILQDADRLDAFGVHDLWRMIHYAADKERTLKQSLDYFWNEAVERYRNELEKFHFEHVRETAEKRLENHIETVERIQTEEEAEDIL